jgi:hypothetical protein
MAWFGETQIPMCPLVERSGGPIDDPSASTYRFFEPLTADPLDRLLSPRLYNWSPILSLDSALSQEYECKYRVDSNPATPTLTPIGLSMGDPAAWLR